MALQTAKKQREERCDELDLAVEKTRREDSSAASNCKLYIFSQLVASLLSHTPLCEQIVITGSIFANLLHLTSNLGLRLDIGLRETESKENSEPARFITLWYRIRGKKMRVEFEFEPELHQIFIRILLR